MIVSSGSVYELIHKAKAALEHGDINFALHLVHNFVERIITEPICTAQVFASNDLDQLCLRIGHQNLASVTASQDLLSLGRKNRPTIVYLVSRLQSSGGHSRLVQDFIREQPEKNHLILSTEIGGPSDKQYFSGIFANNENLRFILAPSGNFQARLTWIQSTLLATQPEYTHLFSCHKDSVAVAALVPKLNLKASFYHHGDHHLCLGVHLRHLTHIDLHPMGYHYCRNELGVDNRYLPLTIEDKYCESEQNNFTHSKPLTTATAARFNKVEIPYYVSYLDTIPRVLQATNGRHIHIGKLTPWALRRIHNQLRKHGLQKDRFVYAEWVPSVWETLQEHNVNVYIASFPYGAGLTLIEAMGAGIPVIMHQHMYSRVLSGLELAYPEAFRWSDPEDLLVHLASLQPEKLEYESKLSRLQYEKFHRPKILQTYLQDPDALQVPVPPLMSGFRPQYDEWAAWAEAQLSFFRLAYRFAYRIWRRLRSLLN